MSSYIVLARKWRPQTFADLVGQQHIAVTLQNAIMQNRVAHAFLFTGSRGVGKTSSARIFAKALNCEHAPSEEPCNACQSCREITEGRSMDVIEIDGASNRGINEIRDVLEAVRYAPSRDRYKIYIIDEVHMLTTEAFNALLKTLEEPPPHVIFIFATTDPNKIPVTILSRCQRYDFKRIGNEDLFAHLTKIAQAEHIEFEPSALRLIARAARGGVRDALSAMDQVIAFAPEPITGERAAEVLGVATRETLTAMVNAVLDGDVARAVACIGRVEHYGQNLTLFANDLLEYLRDATVVAAAPQADIPTELSPAERSEIRARLNPSSLDRFERLFKIWYETTDGLSKNLSPRLALEMAAIRMCKVEPVVPLDNILRKLDAITRALSGQIRLSPDALDSVRAYLSPSFGEAPAGEKKNPRLSDESALSPLFGRDAEESAAQPAAGIASGAHEEVSDKIRESVDSDVHSFDSRLKPEQSSKDSCGAERAQPAAERTPDKSAGNGSGDYAHVSNTIRGFVYSDVNDASSCSNTEQYSKINHNSGGAQPQDQQDDCDGDVFGDWQTDNPNDDDEDARCFGDWNDAAAGIEPTDGDDADDDGSDLPEHAATGEKNEKMLAVSVNRLKRPKLDSLSQDNPDDLLYGWQQIVQKLAAPLSTIMSKAHVRQLTRECVAVSLPRTYKDIINAGHAAEISRVLSKLLAPGCRFSADFDQAADDTETLAAVQAKRDFEAQEKSLEHLKNSPLFKDVCHRFGIRSDSIRFTFNQDRTSS